MFLNTDKNTDSKVSYTVTSTEAQTVTQTQTETETQTEPETETETTSTKTTAQTTEKEKKEDEPFDEIITSENVAHLALGTEGSLTNYIGTPIYSKPDEGSETIANLHYNCCVKIIDAKSTKKWLAVSLSRYDDKIGYIQAKRVKNVILEIGSKNYSKTRNSIVREAYSHLGQRYKPKGKTLDGTTCNGFVRLLYKNQGIEIPRKPFEQRDFGKIIPEKKALPGDIVYYYANGNYGHVGIYIGDGYMINSAGHDGQHYPDGGVRISKLKYHDREKYSIVRIIKD